MRKLGRFLALGGFVMQLMACFCLAIVLNVKQLSVLGDAVFIVCMFFFALTIVGLVLWLFWARPKPRRRERPVEGCLNLSEARPDSPYVMRAQQLAAADPRHYHYNSVSQALTIRGYTRDESQLVINWVLTGKGQLLTSQ